MKITLLLVAFLFALSGSLQAKDWSFLRGPNLNGTTSESPAKTKLAESDIAWRVQLGKGSSGVTTKGNRVFSMGNVDNQDVVYCLDAATGREVWKHSYPCKFEKRMWEGGTSATPTLDGDSVYVFSYDGQLVCLDQATGKERWRKHVMKEFGGKLSTWKYAGSPLVLGSAIVLDIGGKGNSTLALHKDSGEKIWGSGNDGAGYAPVMPMRVDGQTLLLAFKAKAMVGLEARTGAERFRIPWETSYDVNASSPVVLGSTLLISSGYPKTGRAALYDLASGSPKKLWQNDDVKTKMSSCAVYKGHVYVVTEKRGEVLCLDARSGKIVWNERGGGNYGNLVVAGDKLVVLSDSGVLRIADANPSGWTQHSELKVLEGRCWVQPTLSHGRIFCRNNLGELVCVNAK